MKTISFSGLFYFDVHARMSQKFDKKICPHTTQAKRFLQKLLFFLQPNKRSVAILCHILYTIFTRIIYLFPERGKKEMRKTVITVVGFLCLLLMLCSTAGYGADKAMPEALKAIADKAETAASGFAKQLDGGWGDSHAALTKSGEKEAFAGFEELQAVLSGFVAETDAYYVYALYPSGDAKSSSYFVTVDGSESPDEYGTEYDFESTFYKAWSGTAAAHDLFWKDDDGELRISAYAPIHNGAGEVVALLGVDVPAPEAADYPDWILEK